MEKKLEKVLLFVREQPEEDEDFVRIRDVEFKKHNIEIVEINIRDYHSNEIAKELYRYGKEKNILAFIEKIDTLIMCHSFDIPCIACGPVEREINDLFNAEIYYSSFKGLCFEDIEDVFKRFHSIPIEVFETERCIVKEMDLSRFDEFCEMYKDPEFSRYIEPLFRKKDEYKYQETYIRSVYPFYGYGMWNVIDKKTDKMIGRVGIEPKNRGKEFNIELGYALLGAYQRKGIATEICRKLFEVVKTEFAITELACFIHETNYASIEFAKSLGFVFEKEIKDNHVCLQKYVKKL